MVVELSEKAVKSELPPPGEQRSPGRILVVPANDDADEIAAAMFAQLLDQNGYAAIPFSLDFSRDEKFRVVQPDDNDVFCISALPPFAFAGAIALSLHLHLRFPQTKVLIGIWGFAGNTERALQRFQQSRPEQLVTSLAGGLKFFAERHIPEEIHSTI